MKTTLSPIPMHISRSRMIFFIFTCISIKTNFKKLKCKLLERYAYDQGIMEQFHVSINLVWTIQNASPTPGSFLLPISCKGTIQPFFIPQVLPTVSGQGGIFLSS